MGPAEWDHFPPRPSEIDLAMTRPDDAGRFQVSFVNPNDRIEAGRHQVVVSLSVRGEGGKSKRRGIHFVDARRDGRYRVAFQLDPKDLAKATVGVTFFNKQPTNPDFAREFFVEGKSGGYSGIRLGHGAEVKEIPFEE